MRFTPSPNPLPMLPQPPRTPVMNTQEEIFQAFADFRAGQLQQMEDDVWAADE
jgi:hypothetical protein